MKEEPNQWREYNCKGKPLASRGMEKIVGPNIPRDQEGDWRAFSHKYDIILTL
jgi:hypothetical protein